MAATLKHVAERAGVSRSAVSRTFTPGASVSPATRDKVERAARELGYRPNALASSLTTGRTKLIGLVSDNFRNPIFLQVFDLFTRGLQKRGLRPLLVNLSEAEDRQGSVAMLLQYSVDGVIVASSTLPPGFAQAFADAGLPVVHSFGRRAARPRVPVIGIDNVACGRLAARTLVERGHADIAFLGGPEGATSTQDRLKGFMAETALHDHVTTSASFASAYSFEAGRAEMLRLLGRERETEAYFCGDDVLSIGALSAVRSWGLRVPEDIGIIGLNDMEMAGWENIDLTTIRQPVEAIIEASIERVTRMLEGKDTKPDTRVFECELVERGTLRAR